MKPFHYNQEPLYSAAASVLQGQQLTEGVVAFNNMGFKQLNGLMSDKDIHTAVNSTIKSATQKLNDSTWDVVTDIYGRRKNSTWAGDWILAREGGGSWLTIKNGGSFKAQDSIDDVLSFFEIEEDMENRKMKEAKGDEYSSLLVKVSRAMLEGTYAEAAGQMDDETVISTVKKLFPNGATYQKYDNSLYWEKAGGFAGEKGLNTAREKLEKAGFKYAKAKLVGLPDGSTSGFKTYLLNKKLGWYVTLIQFYGQTTSSNRYSLSLKKVAPKAHESIDEVLSFFETEIDEAADDFYLLPGQVINNELYVAVRNLNAIQSSLRNGSDFNVSSFKSVITSLNAIAKQAKSFKAGEKVPVSYQYKS